MREKKKDEERDENEDEDEGEEKNLIWHQHDDILIPTLPSTSVVCKQIEVHLWAFMLRGFRSATFVSGPSRHRSLSK